MGSVLFSNGSWEIVAIPAAIATAATASRKQRHCGCGQQRSALQRGGLAGHIAHIGVIRLIHCNCVAHLLHRRAPVDFVTHTVRAAAKQGATRRIALSHLAGGAKTTRAAI